MSFTASVTIGGAGRKAAHFLFSYEEIPWDESTPWATEDSAWGLYAQRSFVGLGGQKKSYGAVPAWAHAFRLREGAIKETKNAALFANIAALVAGAVVNIPGTREAVFSAQVASGFAGEKGSRLSAFFDASTLAGFGWAKGVYAGLGLVQFIDFQAGHVPIPFSLRGPAFFAHTTAFGIGGRKTFSYSQIQEADVATIYQGGRVRVLFVQGESVERNIFYFMPDGTTPIPDLSTYTARMDLREYQDDPNPLVSLSSANADIFLSDTGLIVWEIPGETTSSFEAPTFSGDLFVDSPDGDSIMVCGFDFEMTMSNTRRV